MSSVISLQISS